MPLKGRLFGLPGKVLVMRKFNQEKKKVRTLEDAVSFAFDFDYHGVTIRPLQVREELAALVKKMQDLSPKVVLEIGTSHGGTLYLLSRLASSDASIISVDLRGGTHGGGYSRLRTPIYKSFARGRQRIHLINGNSHEDSTLTKVRHILNGRDVDFLFIDGDHTYDGVKADFDMYSGLVRNGGIVAFHDIVEHIVDPSVKVSTFWNEVKSNYEHDEIVKDWKQGWGGIGVIYRKT